MKHITFSDFIQKNYEIKEWKHSIAILKHDFPKEWSDLIGILNSFRLKKSWILAKGGRKSEISNFIDTHFYQKGWLEKGFQTQITVNLL